MVHVDMNRAGLPLLETVSEMGSMELTVRYTVNMQEDFLCCDANISVHPIRGVNWAGWSPIHFRQAVDVPN